MTSGHLRQISNTENCHDLPSVKEDTDVEVECKTYLMAMRQLFMIAGRSKGQGRLPLKAGEDLIPCE